MKVGIVLGAPGAADQAAVLVHKAAVHTRVVEDVNVGVPNDRSAIGSEQLHLILLLRARSYCSVDAV